MTQRLTLSSQWTVEVQLRTTEDAAQFAFGQIGHEAQEVFIVVAFDNALNVRSTVEVARGSYNALGLHVPAVLAAVLLSGCDRFLVAHNHSSGDPRPSDDDLATTRRIAKAADACDLYLDDHLIVTPNPSIWRSFTQLGLLVPKPWPVTRAVAS